MAEIKLTKERVKEFLVRAQMLSGDKLPAGKKSVLKVLDELKAIQVDSIAVAGTNQEIALNSRIKSFVPDKLDQLLYDDRNAFEYWLKALCILPMDSYPYYQMNMKKENPWTGRFLKEYKKSCKDILLQIKKNGPMALSQFDDDRKVPGWWHAEARLVKWLLEALWNSGQVMIHHRKGRIRYFDLTERCIPKNKPLRNFRTYQKKAVQDILSAQRLFDFRSVSGEVWSTLRDSRKVVQKEFLDRGIIVPLTIKGSDREYFILKKDIKLLDKKGSIAKKVRLIAPLDTITWDRKLVSDIFDFECTFEIYKPKKLRRYGYYCLFILYGKNFVGRLDISSEKKKGIMHVNSVHWEDGFKPGDEFLKSFADALTDHKRFMGLKTIEITKNKFSGRGKIIKKI